METLHLLELPVILYLQTLGNWAIFIARAFTFLGNEDFYFIVMPALFWCFDFRFGIQVGIMLILSNNLNAVLKLAFHSPRPYWINPNLNISITESSFGMPSGHAQNAASLWGLLAVKLHKKYRLILILVIFLIGFSRILLGVHFISDVMMGWLVGGLLLLLYTRIEHPIRKWITNQTPIRLHILSLMISIALILIPILIISSLKNWTVATSWMENAGQSIPDAVVDPLNPAGVISIAGVWLGMSNGLLLLFNNFGEFDISGTWYKKTLRYVIGLIGIIAVWYGLGAVFPRSDDFLGYSLRYIRYTLAGLWISYIAPVLFSQLKLAGFKQKTIKLIKHV